MRTWGPCWVTRVARSSGGGKGIRTPDPDLAKVVLYQLSYAPRLIRLVTVPECLANTCWMRMCMAAGVLRKVVGLRGLEPLTSRLSGVCSNHLSYKPG